MIGILYSNLRQILYVSCLPSIGQGPVAESLGYRLLAKIAWILYHLSDRHLSFGFYHRQMLCPHWLSSAYIRRTLIQNIRVAEIHWWT
ncbi:hypothetical protein VTK26DRAFT_3797 [Humicola hyalothermophila]